MQKLLLFIAVLVGVFYVRKYLQRMANPPRRAAPDTARRQPDAIEAETMRECAHCGVLVPPSESVTEGDACFCCAEHARAGRAERG